MNRLTEFSMKHISAVLILCVLLFAGGTYSATTLKVENFPDISFPVVMVTTTYQAAPKDIVDEITKPLEKSLSSLQNVNKISSTSSDNVSSIVLEFEQGVDTEDKKRDVESLVSGVKLPASADKPRVSTFGFASVPSYYLAVYAKDGMSQTELDKLYEDVIEPAFSGISGIDHIDAIGNRETKLDIKLDADALNQYGLTPAQVSSSIRAYLSNGPAGLVKMSGNTESIRVTGQADSIYALDNLALTASNGATLQLKQVAKVEALSDATFISRLDDKPALGINLYKTKDANAVEFSDSVEKLISGWEKTQPNVAFKKVFNMADSVKESISGMLREGIMGAVLASIMILLFLRNVRMTVIVLVSIPLSILITMLMMGQLGLTLNIMTLGGMAIAVGRVVDDSIVVIENIYSKLHTMQQRNESVIKEATKQVSGAITSSTLTTVGVFGPIGMVSGTVGEIFRPFALTLACALLASLIVALTVIPLLTKLLVLRQRNMKLHDESEKPDSKLMKGYKGVLAWALGNRGKTIVIAFSLFVVSIVTIVPNLNVTFIPESESDRQMYFEVKMPYETALETTDAKVKELESVLRSAKDVNGEPVFTFVESLVGYNWKEDQVPYMAVMMTEVNPKNNADKVKEEYKQTLLKELPKGSKVEPMLLGGGGVGTGGADFTYSLKGDDLQTLQQASALIKEKLEQHSELSEVKDSLDDAKQQVNVKVDENKARLYGLTVAQVKDSVRSWVMEDKLGDIKFDNVTYETRIQLDDNYKNSLDALGHMMIKTANGSTVYLNEVADIRHEEAPASIHREKEQQIVSVTAKINSADKGGISKQLGTELSSVELPSGVTRELAGVTDDINSSFKQLFVAMGVSILVVYFIMVLAFGNASAPFAILFSLPLAAIGGLLGLIVTGQSLDVTSLIGFMMLIGIVVTNAIVLIDRVQQLRDQGYTVRHALTEAGVTRLRPIIMTALATVMALLPLALGFSKGTIISQGLAVVVIGGLTTSTVLTLLVVPVVYEWIESMKVRFSGGKKSKGAAAAVTGETINEQ